MKNNRTLAIIAAATLASACATTETGSPEARSVIDRAVARCTASVLGGAILGAIVGNNSGSSNARRGALTGAAAGGAVCVVIMAAAQNEAAMIESQRSAVASGVGGASTFSTREGRQLAVRTEVEPVVEPASGVDGSPRECRYARSTLELEGVPPQALEPQKFCRVANGAWELA